MWTKSHTFSGEAKARRAAGGHDVAGPGDVVAQHFERVLAQENPAGAGDLFGPAPGVLDRQAQVLGGIGVGQLDGFGQVGGQDDPAVGCQRGGGNLAPAEAFDLPADLDLHGFGQPADGVSRMAEAR